MQKLVERSRIDADDCLMARNQTFVCELDRDPERRLGGALAGAGLQHPQLAPLDCELKILHVAIVPFEHSVDTLEPPERRRHRFFHRRLVGVHLHARLLADLLRGADAGDHVLALGVDQELTVEPFLTGRMIAVKATPVAEVSPMLPNTIACTFTAVPQLSGILCRRR